MAQIYWILAQLFEFLYIDGEIWHNSILSISFWNRLHLNSLEPLIIVGNSKFYSFPGASELWGEIFLWVVAGGDAYEMRGKYIWGVLEIKTAN